MHSHSRGLEWALARRTWSQRTWQPHSWSLQSYGFAPRRKSVAAILQLMVLLRRLRRVGLSALVVFYDMTNAFGALACATLDGIVEQHIATGTVPMFRAGGVLPLRRAVGIVKAIPP